MRSAWLSFAVVLLGCSNDGFTGQDAGDAMTMDESEVGTIEGGAEDSPRADNYVPPAIHRVFVANSNTTNTKAVVGWDNADKLSNDRPPDVAIVGGVTTATALAIVKDRLYSWDNSSRVLSGFDNVGTLTSSANPVVTLGANMFLGSGQADAWSLFYVPSKDLLFTTNPAVNSSGIQMFANASTLTNNTMAKARFGASGEMFFAAALDGNDQLFAGSNAQGAIRFMTGASGKTGLQTFVMDFGSPSMLIQAMVTDGTRLYAGGGVLNGAPSVFIYNLAGIQPGAMPSVTLNGANGIPANGVVFTMSLVNDILVVYCNNKVLTFSGAKTLTGTSQATVLTADMTNLTKVALSEKTGLLYTLGTYKGNSGLQVWKSPTSNPMFQAEIRMGIESPMDLVLYEP